MIYPISLIYVNCNFSSFCFSRSSMNISCTIFSFCTCKAFILWYLINDIEISSYFESEKHFKHHVKVSVRHTPRQGVILLVARNLSP